MNETSLKTAPINFDSMTQADFELHLPDFFATGSGKVSADPRLQKFLATHPDCAALVRDLETIAEHARSLFEPNEPSDDVWARIQTSLHDDPIAAQTGIPQGVTAGTQSESGALSRHGEPDQLVTGGSLHDIE